MTGPDDSTNGAAKLPVTDLSNQAIPPIAAAFCVKFDDRKGYTLAWHRALDGVKVDGIVEFKCLPSGLHNVKEDLVYFVHEQYAGISAFLNREDEHAARKAQMIAVGVMVPIENGRMGKSWLHAEALKYLADKQVENQDDYSTLETYWDKHKSSDEDEEDDDSNGSPSQKQSGLNISIPQKPAGYRRSRAMSVSSGPNITQHILPTHHPALALPDLLHTFGPLIFPLYRASLLRKRILILGEAPVERTCNFVYNLSILSSLPREAASLLLLDETSDLRLQPLFNVGISDIAELSERESGQGWIACTTDDVLCTKSDLFDLLVIMPNADSMRAISRGYPKLVSSSPELSKAYPKVGVRASQRDGRRFRILWKGLQVMPASLPAPEEAAVEENDDVVEEDAKSIATSVSSTVSRKSIIEPQSWSRIAYTSLIWWASAGDKRAGLEEAEENEADQDASLLDLQNPDDQGDGQGDEEGKTKEVAIVAYFHRLSTVIFAVLAECVTRMEIENEDSNRYHDDEATEASPDNDERQARGEDERALLPKSSNNSDSDSLAVVDIRQQDVSSMGLDIWSDSDRKFIEEMISFWWDQEAVVHGGRIECCGLRIL